MNTSKEDNSSEIDTILEREKDKEIFYTQQINKLGDEINLLKNKTIDFVSKSNNKSVAEDLSICKNATSYPLGRNS